jgi:hypothetical protein
MHDEDREGEPEAAGEHRSHPRDAPALSRAFELAEWLSDTVAQPEQNWRQVATWARELARIADQLAG